MAMAGCVRTRDAIHAVRQSLAVPMHAGVLGQFVGDKSAHPVSLHDLDGGAWALAVVAPQMRFIPGANSRTTGSATKWNSLTPWFMRQGKVHPFSVTTGL
jgi:hypothetical protein